MRTALGSRFPTDASAHRTSRTESVIRYGDGLAASSPRITSLHTRGRDQRDYLPRYRWVDPAHKPVYRIGIFAGIHGDEQSSVIAALQLLKRLELDPLPGRFHEIFLYPVCNPWGFDNNRREGSSERDLNRLFWQEEAEVRLLEQDLRAKNFDGIIALHTDDTS